MGPQRIEDSNNFLQNLKDPNMEPLNWSEGLSLGSASFVYEWSHDPTYYSLNSKSGSTTMSRAKANGIVTGKIVETAFYYKSYSVDVTDMIRFILTNDGGTNNLRDSLIDKESTFTTMGGAWAHKIGCRMDPNLG